MLKRYYVTCGGVGVVVVRKQWYMYVEPGML